MWFNLREFSLTQIYPPKVTVLKDMILHFFLHLSQSEKLSEIKPPLRVNHNVQMFIDLLFNYDNYE